MRRTPAKRDGGRREQGEMGGGGGGGGQRESKRARETERERGSGDDEPTILSDRRGGSGLECIAGWSGSKGYSRGLGDSGIGTEGGGTEQVNVPLRRGGWVGGGGGK
jgi:hypothetical protein